MENGTMLASLCGFTSVALAATEKFVEVKLFNFASLDTKFEMRKN
jgi:hypothetical protein